MINEGKPGLTIPFPDYHAHPAYRSLDPIQAFPGSEEEIADYLEALDQGYRKVQQAATGVDELVSLFRIHVADKADALKRELARTLQAPFQTAVTKCVDGAVQTLWNNAQHELRRSRSATSPADRNLRERGYVTAEIERSERENLYRLARPFMEILESRARAYPMARLSHELPRGAELVRAAQRLLRTSGLLDVAEQNRGSPCELRFITLHHAHAAQTWYKDCYQDSGLPTARWSYLHYDKDASLIKAMICLHEVDEDAGPFAMLEGSGAWLRNEFQYAFGNFSHTVVPTPAGGPGNYYRTGFDGELGRRWWLSLPRALQVQSHFGDDILDHSETAGALLPHLKVFTGSDSILFDGGRFLHLGGTARKKPRWVIHLGLEPVIKRGFAQGVRNWLKTSYFPQRALYLARQWRHQRRQ